MLAGYLNRFGHPAPSVLARYQSRGIAIVTSADCGAWAWRGGQAVCERERRRRYWHALPKPAPAGPDAGAAADRSDAAAQQWTDALESPL
jgi:competence protein ComEC